MTLDKGHSNAQLLTTTVIGHITGHWSRGSYCGILDTTNFNLCCVELFLVEMKICLHIKSFFLHGKNPFIQDNQYHVCRVASPLGYTRRQDISSNGVGIVISDYSGFSLERVNCILDVFQTIVYSSTAQNLNQNRCNQAEKPQTLTW